MYIVQAFRLYVLKHKRLSEYGIITKEIHSIQKINPFCGFIRESKWRGELREEKCQTPAQEAPFAMIEKDLTEPPFFGLEGGPTNIPLDKCAERIIHPTMVDQSGSRPLY
ncbi:hypothetical protein SCA6_004945 [Theobroma cacao]